MAQWPPLRTLVIQVYLSGLCMMTIDHEHSTSKKSKTSKLLFKDWLLQTRS